MGLSVSSVGGQLLFIEATKTVPWPSHRVGNKILQLVKHTGKPIVGYFALATGFLGFCFSIHQWYDVFMNHSNNFGCFTSPTVLRSPSLAKVGSGKLTVTGAPLMNMGM